ncbi:C-type lectin domain family 4 member A isoform X2 [Rattus norvegicus]|uniref:C-type lectin domain family 4 member A isoform X2 n=1 Tax=Rattus norvegicus TaxID=10116 RepID=UPI0008102D01|nr:C-type lectin domain family 4 member A isoform X2 [Rattus norvegicus]|eukprot:XP_017448230.1 PREDICTED: C-type lectin domain family 4 member A isoform X2 [Rattus norvegicus]
MASEITYAEVRIKNESNSSVTYSGSPAAPREKPTRHLIYFQKYSQFLEEKKAIKGITHKELNCIKNVLLMEEKSWSCCPKNWKPFGSHCYWVTKHTSTYSKASWNESEKNCFSMGAHLLVIHSKEEQDFITGFLNRDAAYFIGLWDSGHRQWQWVSQTPYNASATFWHKGEPSSDDEKCVIINHLNSGWGWNDIPCSGKQQSVCQMKEIQL